MYPEKISAILAPVLEQYPAYQLKPVSYVFGNSRVEVAGPADGADRLNNAIINALCSGGFEAYPISKSDSPIALNVRAKEF